MGKKRENKQKKIKMGDTPSGGGTPLSEVRLEEKRIALRRALKREYMGQYYSPENQGYTGKHVFDAAFHRYNALQNSQVKMVKMNFGNFLIWAGTFAMPVGIAWCWYCRHQKRFKNGCREGKVGIDHPSRRPLWFSF